MEVEVTGEIEQDEGVLVIRRILTQYRLRVPEDQRERAERAHAVHVRGCPVARSLQGGIAIETELEFA